MIFEWRAKWESSEFTFKLHLSLRGLFRVLGWCYYLLIIIRNFYFGCTWRDCELHLLSTHLINTRAIIRYHGLNPVGLDVAWPVGNQSLSIVAFLIRELSLRVAGFWWSKKGCLEGLTLRTHSVGHQGWVHYTF